MTKQEFFSRGNEYFFFDDPAAVAEYCKTYWPEDCVHIIRVADEVCRNYFLFDLEHDMERTWEPVIFDPEGDVDWEYRPGNDPEFTFQFNRHRFFICLGQAYWLTGEDKYARHFVRLLMSWITGVKRTEETEKTTWRILETGIRGEFWVKAMRYFKDSPYVTDEVVDAFYSCLVEHAEFLIQMHSPYRYMSNWGVIENHGLFEIGIAMPDEERRKRYTSIALEHLEAEARMQIMGDGVQWEQSPLYHNEVLHCYEDVLILASRNDIEVPDTILNAVHKMACADLMWKKPDHKQLLMGDSDDMDIRDYISTAAVLFRDPMLKFGGFPVLDFESVWDLGIESARLYQEMEIQEPDFLSGALSDSGNYYLRDKWGEDGSLLHFHCGTMGAGHGHSDKLHVDLCVGGEDVLTDAGRYTYVVDSGRFEFKDPTAHNTITVDDKFFTVCKDSWECSKLCQPVKGQFRFTDSYEYVQGGHLGYAEDGVFINRKIVYIKPDIYLIMDEMYTGGAHTYRQYWNFSERGQVRLEGANQSCTVFQGNKARADFYFLTPGTEPELYEGKIARHYNRYEKRQGICVKYQAEGFASLLTVIHAAPDGKQEPILVEKIPVNSALKGIQYPDSMAEAVKISCHGTEYVVIFCHQEVNSPTDLEEADGCMGYGNVIVFDKKKDVLAGTVLQY